MLLRSEHLDITSSDPPAIVLQRLRGVTSEWRESQLTPAARRASILGWKLRESGDTFVVRARIAGRNGFLPRFVGTVEASPSGSHIVGQLRLNWFSRIFMTVWFGAIASAALLALFGVISGVDWGGERIWMAVFMLLPAVALFSFGVWMVDRSSGPPIRAIRELLATVADNPDTLHNDHSARVSSRDDG
jgi:hypothetical protein